MNRKQKKVIAVGVTLFVVMAVYPLIYDNGIYYVLLSEIPKDHGLIHYTLFFPRLVLQWLVLVVATVGLVWAFHDRKA